MEEEIGVPRGGQEVTRNLPQHPGLPSTPGLCGVVPCVSPLSEKHLEGRDFDASATLCPL